MAEQTNRREGGRGRREKRDINEDAKNFDISTWTPKTEIGKKVKNGEITSIDEIYKLGRRILESEIIDYLVPDIKVKVVDVKKTTRVTRAGRNFSFRVTVIVGDGNGHIGIGTSKNIERINAQSKAMLNAKLNLRPIRRGCGSWECNCSNKHSIPFISIGKCSSLRVTLLPAPNGVGIAASDSIKEVFELAGIKDIWSATRGATDTKLNFVKAAIEALYNTCNLKLSGKFKEE
ncbi:MAG: 30S ribosomal protein S5 [archaeon]